VLEHFADDVTFTSPTAARLIPASAGLIRGKEALRRYWSDALSRNPDLRFQLLGTYVGVDTIVISFRQQTRVVVTEVLVFDGPLVVSGHAAHFID
jgi:ketosteroid isomerase-like protein